MDAEDAGRWMDAAEKIIAALRQSSSVQPVPDEVLAIAQSWINSPYPAAVLMAKYIISLAATQKPSTEPDKPTSQATQG